MKYLLLLAVVIGAVWWLRQSGRGRGTAASAQDGDKGMPQDMVSCTHCQVHVPRSDATPGRAGLYCCAEHRQQHEG